MDQNRTLVKCLFDRDYAAAIILARRGVKLGKKKLCLQTNSTKATNTKQKQQINSHINESFQAVNYSIKPSEALKYRQLKLCAKQQKSISAICDANFAYYSIL